MLSSANSLENFYEHFQDLLAEDLELGEIEQDLRAELLNMLNSLADQDRALAEVEKDIEEARSNNELSHTFNLWEFVSIANPDEPGVREVLLKLPNANEILTLLDQVVVKRRNIVLRKEAVDEAVLSAWRDEHPYFSSMGTIDADIQSETLKDAAKLARR